MIVRFFLLLAIPFALATVSAADRSDLPVSAARGEAADLVREWWAAGEAAGNIGDFYDNRDRGHRLLDTKLFPQLQRVTYTEREIELRMDYAAARAIRTNVVFGNSSTSAPLLDGGSNTRNLYLHGASLLYEQYIHNNLYAYPEHQDHDPGHNGNPGYGDVFPLNTPYLYTSQGSSGSEMEFLQAVAHTLAAFRPEVKTRLIQRGLLMPTIQMLLRRSYKRAPEPADYFTGKAHPTVFESTLIDEGAMVRGAHALNIEAAPPMAQIRVIREDQPRVKAEFADFTQTEKLCDTPCVIGRVFRGFGRARTMVISAETSYDLSLNPLTWRWAVLRGDTNRISIKPLNENASRVEIAVAWHERRPVEPGSDLESNRIDIGCFVSNGFNYSAPAFICYYFSDAEARAYDSAGRPLEIGHNAGESQVSITNWSKLFELIAQDGARAQFLKTRLTEDQWNAITAAAPKYEEIARAERADADAENSIHSRDSNLAAQIDRLSATNKNASNLKVLREEHEKVVAQHEAAKARHAETLGALNRRLQSTRAILEPLIHSWVTNATFTFDNRRDLERVYKAADRPAREEFERGKELLVSYGALKKSPGFDFALTPIRTKAGPLDERLTPYERCLVQRLNAAAISLVVLRGAAESEFIDNYVEPGLFAKKDWRDVFHSDADGKITGWTRYSPASPPTEFDAEGNMVIDGKTQNPKYVVKPNREHRGAKLVWTRGG